MKTIAILLFSTVLLYGADTCQSLQDAYFQTETEWSELYTEDSFLHKERERLSNIINEAEAIDALLYSAKRRLGSNGILTKRELYTLNTRIPPERGRFIASGMFVMPGDRQLNIDEAKHALDNIVKWSQESLRDVEDDLKTHTGKLDALNQKMEQLETQIAKVCHITTSAPPSAYESYYTKVSEADIINRLTQKELQRQAEVSNRRWGDIERQWLDKYYRCHRYRYNKKIYK